MRISIAIFTFCLASLYSCKNADGKKMLDNSEPSAYSLMGDPLYPLGHSPATYQKRDSLLRVAEMEYENDPLNLDNIIWYGRRLAYLDRYDDAIAIFTLGMETHPDSPELFRHRGHRFITTRNFDNATEDFITAADLAKDRSIEIEPDGLPNSINIPLSNLQFNIYYHLGLVYFLKGDFELARDAYVQCMEYSDNPDLKVATADWLYMTYLRLGLTENAQELLAQIPDDLTLVENDGYYQRIKMYKGIVQPEELVSLDADMDDLLQLVTQGYGVAHHYKMEGNTEAHADLLNKIIATGYWPAFGYIAAEADLYALQTQAD